MGKFQDLSGQKFGRLTVIKRGESIVYSNGKHATRWLCQCECGSPPKLIRAGHLKNGSIKSCGCLNKEILSKTFKKENTYEEKDNYIVGYTNKGLPFYFDKIDYDTVKKYCWYIDSEGYVTTNIQTDSGKRTVLRMHVLIMDPENKNLKVDHILGKDKRNDNRRYNLRLTTNQENTMNASLRKDNSSGVTGVNWDSNTNKWEARIKKNYKTIHLGKFDNFEDAVSAIKEAEKKYFGKFAYDYSQQIGKEGEKQYEK